MENLNKYRNPPTPDELFKDQVELCKSAEVLKIS